MAEKRTLKVIEEDFQGLDYKASDLRKNLSFLRKADNASYSISDGVVKRAGHEAIGSPGLLLGTSTYSYLDRVTGETKESLLGFGTHAFKLTDYTFSFYSTAAHGLGCYSRFRENGLGQREFVVYDQQSDLVIFTYTLTDTSSALSNTIYALCLALQAAGFTVTFPTDTLVVQSNVTGGAGTDTTINFSYGSPAVGKFYTALNKTVGLLEWIYVDNLPTATSARVRRRFSWSHSAGDVWGRGSAYIGSIKTPITGAGTSVSPQVVTFSHWEGIPWGYYLGATKGNNPAVEQVYLAGVFEEFLRYTGGTGSDYAVNPNGSSKYPTIQGINLNNKFYFCNLWDTRGSVKDDVIVERGSTAKLFCYDGKCIYRAGVSSPIEGKTTISPSVTNGQWKYIVTLSYLDANGVEWESNASEVVSNNTGGTGGGTTIGYTNGIDRDVEYAIGYGYFDTRSGIVRTGGTAGPTFEVSGSAVGTGIPTVNVGDKIYFSETNSTSTVADTPEEKTVTAINYSSAPYTITVNSALSYSASAGQTFSTGMFWNVYRTKQYGNLYYLIKKFPLLGGGTGGAIFTFVDQIADSSLELEYIEPLAGEEHDLPPAGRVITSHQGNIVLGGAPSEPNTVNWSGVDGIEYFPRAFNSTDIPSTVKGAITGIFSDTDDRLAVFKSRGYYEVNGDLATKAISVVVKKEGDYGVSSQLSLQKINGAILGVGERGVVVVNNGDLGWELMARINPLIRAKFLSLNVDFLSKLALNLSTSVNDPLYSQYILHIPSSVTHDPFSLTLVYNYERDKWTTFTSENTYYDFSGGMTIYDNELYAVSYLNIGVQTSGNPIPTTISLSNNTSYVIQTSNALISPSARWGGQLFRRKNITNILDNQGAITGAYNDFGSTYNFNIITSFESLGEPSAFKEFDVVRVWFVPPTVLNGTTSITTSTLDVNMQGGGTALKTFADWNFTSKVSDVSKTLTGYIETPYIDLNLRDKQARSLALQILNSDRNAFGFTAIEYIYSLPYSSEASKKYGY